MFGKFFSGRHHQNFRRLAFAHKKYVPITVLTLSAVVVDSHYRQERNVTHCDGALFVKPIVDELKIVPVSTLDVPVSNFWQKVQEQGKRTLAKMTSAYRYMERLLHYAVLGAPLSVLGPLAYFFPSTEDFAWDYSIWAIIKLGPTFIKLAQWASTRPDLFPPRLIDKLTKLQDDVDVFYSKAIIENTIREAFGNDWKDRLSFDAGKPLGAGSVAQVFKGKLKSAKDDASEGVDVAIKMIHPHVHQLVETDMKLLGKFADMIDSFPSLEILSIGEVCRQFGETMNLQLDLTREASNLVKFAKKFTGETWALFPQPIEGFVTRSVLVETLMKGEKMSDYMNLPDEESTKNIKMRLSDLGCRLVLKMVFFDNFVHGDLHPGNMLVQIDEKGDPRLIILDCGIVYSSKSEEEHKTLVEICLAFMQHDGRRAGKLMIDNAMMRNDAAVRHAESFCESVQKIVDDSEEHSYFEHIGEYVSRVCDLAREHVVRLDPGYFKIAMALKVAEGVSLALNRDLDMVSTCVPIILKARAMRAMGISKFPMEKDMYVNSAVPVPPYGTPSQKK